MLDGRCAAPLPDPTAPGSLPVADLSPSTPLVLDVLPGDFDATRLAADVARYCDQPPAWARLAPYDLDLPTLDALAVVSLSGQAGRRQAEQPVVVESENRTQAEWFLSRLAAADRAPCAVVVHYSRLRGERGRVRWARPATAGSAGRDPLDRLTGGRIVLRQSVLEAGRRLPTGELTDIVDRSRSTDELVAELAVRLLRDVPPETTALLGLVALLGYCHHGFTSLAPVLEGCGDLPWWTDLTGGWRRFEPAWRGAAHALCRSHRHHQIPLLGRLVVELVEAGAIAEAVELCLDASYTGTASDLIAGLGPGQITDGRPRAVERWLGRLPRAERRRHRALAVQARAARRSAAAVPATRRRGPPQRRGGGRSRQGRGAVTARPGRQPLDHSLDGGAAAHPTPGNASPLTLQARLFGTMDVRVGGRRVERWHGRKAKLLLAYLILHPGQPVPGSTLAAAFWPDAPPEASRNRLHVTLHALRADLRTASPAPVVIFDHGYTLNPKLEVQIDTEAFECAVSRGELAEEDKDLETALAAYQDAVREYRGDLLGDHLCDDWTLLPREHYRVRMLDVLGRAAQLAFDTGRYAESIETGQRLLALDFCREDLHRLLMRAYSRLDRPHLAIRQFTLCAQQMKQELGMRPARETVELYQLIRIRSPV
jgi:DNA-binding SARP family transcriptional activator